MKARVWMLVLGIAGLTATAGMGQNATPKSFQGNGRLGWTNAINTNAFCRLEWASQPGGPWHRFSYQPINTIDLHDGTNFTVEVPMFYRVVTATGEAPQGMVWIDGGDVELGQTGIAEPVHTNYISGFWMDEMEVSKAQWDDVAAWAATNGYDITVGGGEGKTNDHPVETVTWYECVKWCNAHSQKDGLTPCYAIAPNFTNLYKTGNVNISNSWVNWSANGYRLPTEAEWEKAARGGRQRWLFPWGGDTIQHARANYYAVTNSFPYDTSPTEGFHPNFQSGGFPYTSPLGSFPANGYGLHDMADNVSEWCWDRYVDYSASYQTDPYGPTSGSDRVVRGGSWGDNAHHARCADRNSDDPVFESFTIGFRCVRGQGTVAIANVPPAGIGSTFGLNNENWKIVSYPFKSHISNPTTSTNLVFDGAFGNPAGSVRVGDVYGETGISAPTNYVGNKLSFYGGSLSFDIYFRFADTNTYPAMVLNGGTNSLYYDFATPTLNSWLSRSIPLSEAGWKVSGTTNNATEAQFKAMLSNLVGLYIYTEWSTGSDDTSVDNITMTSP